jgi:hypothetical protein
VLAWHAGELKVRKTQVTITLVLVVVIVSAGLIGAVSFAAPTEAYVPDWTSVTPDFFTLSPGTVNPVLTKADVTDRTNVTYVADPFLFHEGSTWYMFFEIMTDGNGLLCDIGLATSSDGFHWTYKQVVLDEPFHLAYPQVFKWDGTYYMIPDTYSEDQVKLYKATNFPYTWNFVANIVSGPRYVDSSIFRYNYTWWLFTSDYRYSTYLYYSDNLTDPSSWHAHPMNPIISGDASKARGGGRVTVFNGNTIIRLAQKCDVVYGEAVRAFQVDTLTRTSYAQHEIPQSPIVQASGSGWNKDGMHTVDPWWIGNGWLVVVDGVNYSPSEVWSIGIYVTPLQVTITPTQVKMYVGQSQTFSSSVTGGIPPYTYQWYLNDTAVSGATSSNWTFTPRSAGHYKVYLNVTDGLNFRVQSNVVSDILVGSVYLLLTAGPGQGPYVRGESVTFTVDVFDQLDPALGSSLTLTITGPGNYGYFDVQPIRVPAGTVGEYTFDWVVPNAAGKYVVEVELTPSLLTAYDTAWLEAA